MYGNISVLIMGEAKRRKNLGIPPREKNEDIKLPQLDKKAVQKKESRNNLSIYPTSITYNGINKAIKKR